MKEQQDTAVSLLCQIAQQKGLDYLREGNGKFFVSAFSEMGGDKQDVRLLRYLTECGAHEDLLDAASLTPAMQRAYYSQAVQKLCDKSLISEELAHRVCGIFWQAVYQKDPPVIWEQPVSTPRETPDELFQRGCSCLQQNNPGKEEAAVKWFRLAAEQGHAEAQWYLGYRLMDGIGTPADPVEGLMWFHRAAAGGKIEAHNNIGYSYYYGKGTEQNRAQAAYWYRKGADLGDPWAMSNLSLLYETGCGVEQNLEQALFWCRKSAQLGHTGAQERLPQLEEKKRKETPDISGNKPEFDIVNGALLKYNGTAAKVTVPGGVTRIGPRAFGGNDAVRSVSLPYGLIGMGKEAFAGCRNLREITIPGSVIGVHMDAFSGCRKLKKITMESGVQRLIFGDHLDQLGSVTIVVPDTVRSVTWSSIPDNRRRERMKYPKAIQASKRWTETFQQFFQENPDFRAGKLRSVGVKQLALLALAALLLVGLISAVTGSEGGRTRSQLEPYGLEKSIEDMLLAGTEEIYTYPDGTWMEFYYDDVGQEICRVYVNQENDIENLFEARYDDSGRLVYHQIFDGEGNLLRADSYDFHSSEDTAQRRITLGNGRNLQGISTFDENGYETFTLNHQDGTKTVYVYKDGGVLTNLTEYDAAGEITDEPIAYDWWEGQPKVCNSRQTVIGWAGSNGYVRPYVQGICGGKMKEYSVEDDHAFIETYDSMGNLVEQLYYEDGQLNKLFSREVYHYDGQGNYTGYTDTTYYGEGDYVVAQYDANDIRLSKEIHRFEGEEETVLSSRYETELDDQGREICVREYDGETGQLKVIDETEYDKDGNVAKDTRTYYHEDGTYHVSVWDAEGHRTSDITYYPSGSVQTENAYNREGKHIKTTRYYESGQVQTVTEYSGTGETLSRKRYYENGTIQYLDEYDAQGNLTKSTSYYENGKVDNLTEYNNQGDIRKMVSYYENGQIQYWMEYDDQGEKIKEVCYNEDGTVLK